MALYKLEIKFISCRYNDFKHNTSYCIKLEDVINYKGTKAKLWITSINYHVVRTCNEPDSLVSTAYKLSLMFIIFL